MICCCCSHGWAAERIKSPATMLIIHIDLRIGARVLSKICYAVIYANVIANRNQAKPNPNRIQTQTDSELLKDLSMTIAQIVEIFLNSKIGELITNELMTEIVKLVEHHEKAAANVKP